MGHTHNLLFGTLDLTWKNNGEYAAAIGLRTSNDKSMSLQLAVGTRIFVCDNLCFAGDLIALRRKHTSRLDLHKEIADGLDRYEKGVLSLQEGIECLQRLRLTEPESKGMIFDVFRKKIVPMRLFHPVVETYHAKRDDNHLITAWQLHNAFTEHVKTLSPGPKFTSTLGLGKHFQLN